MLSTTRRRLLSGTGLAALGGALGACGLGKDPFASERGGSGGNGPIVVGSQQYFSNEIIAELYAQILEEAGYTVTRTYQIGQREIYLPQLESGDIDVIPEYGGNLLQYYTSKDQATTGASAEAPTGTVSDAGTGTAADADSVRAELLAVLPGGLTILASAEATDQDTYTVTRQAADAHGLTSIADLAKLGRTVMVAANSELSTRPYGPSGLKSAYGVDAKVEPVEDTGGPLTVKALTDGTVDAANIPSSSPAIVDNGLVVLEDPKGLILPENVTPLVRRTLAVGAAQAIDTVSARLGIEELRALNARSTEEKVGSGVIASDWLKEQGLVGG
ncbi:ABC transporter substrate-binding protein [Actinomyces israelii]|uniref:ABC transporter substrate-binding protein n=1 Tax=Actinomyces israelii TaxID=1659 RepID=A0ABT4IB54_9ACTO|nr:ABC transporter substrate-binding protein [Actinomyces israelii]MCZ0858492.1 ABC transporter substrate-binding protein [Actinomyces israelii]WKR21440.1 Glycine betaine-binding protein YehZ [Actinomyces israelii]